MTELDSLAQIIMNDFPNPLRLNKAQEIRSADSVRYFVNVYHAGGTVFDAEGNSAIECIMNLVKQGCYPMEEPKK